MASRPVLIVTPATRFGSWAWIEKALAARPDQPAIVVGYGRSETAPPHVRFFTLPPFIDYGAWGPRLAERRYLALNLLYYAPLLPLAWAVALVYRPRVLFANGVNAAALLGPLTHFGPKLVLAFHGSIEHAGPRWHALVRRALSPVSLAFVNSQGSAEDLAHAFDPERIEVVHHWADSVFFDVPLDRPRRDRLQVLFVGRLDEEKFDQCLRVCTELAHEGVVELRAVGTGPLQGALSGPGLQHVGYVGDKGRLAEIYGDADVVWAPADVTYVAIPGAEGLAAGCPLVISAKPAVFTHARDGFKVPQAVVDAAVGRVVNGDVEAAELLREWARVGVSQEWRIACRSYARARYSDANIEPIAAAIAGDA